MGESIRAEAKPTHHKCTLGCAVLDGCLGGGIPTNSVTEIVAESGIGKTQLCLQLCLSAQLPASSGGLSGSSLYLHTEFPFPSRRLHQLSIGFAGRFPDSGTSCDNIFVHSVDTAEELLHIIPKLESFILNCKSELPVRVLVIDSISALFRADFENTAGDLKKRSSMFFKISGCVKALARRFDMAVVVTNQVADLVEGEDQEMGMVSSGRRVRPALGLAWASCVNSRVFLSRDHGGEKREMQVVFAPHLEHSSSQFVIKREGVFGVGRED